jgi:hypothetical protein
LESIQSNIKILPLHLTAQILVCWLLVYLVFTVCFEYKICRDTERFQAYYMEVKVNKKILALEMHGFLFLHANGIEPLKTD